jgi:hypothetical protein
MTHLLSYATLFCYAAVAKPTDMYSSSTIQKEQLRTRYKANMQDNFVHSYRFLHLYLLFVSFLERVRHQKLDKIPHIFADWSNIKTRSVRSGVSPELRPPTTQV